MRVFACVFLALVVACTTNSHRTGTCSGTDVLVEGFSPPLVAAAGNGDIERVRRLLRSGADPNGQDCEDVDDGAGAHHKQLGFTPLMLAVGHGYLDVAELLVHAGADPRRTTSDGRGAMSFAMESGRPEAVAFMKRVLGDAQGD
jgi:ankyrin repeat protein